MSVLVVKQRCPAWLDNAHKTFDAAVAAAYGWDYTPETPDDMILSRLLELNLQRSSQALSSRDNPSVSLHFPGYRLYFIRQVAAIIVLLYGGDKSTQRKDIGARQGVSE
ncbi:hypothetical protein U5801_18340 [Lamprobacter modestohalophilus]|uniref:hypothetical protein n=1 Tax=Lamprobacter modestohalophilus TaxID=1064514 RepID=UPI002ADEF4B4|nr:hypothetical protein [Lamprobacter modestohalophilus]MEA1051747.1 hypothetical protein [Lamprobacter modestohalophilus]